MINLIQMTLHALNQGFVDAYGFANGGIAGTDLLIIDLALSMRLMMLAL